MQASKVWDIMDWTTWLSILLAFVLVLLNGFFVLAEFALVKVRPTRIEELARHGNWRARLARGMIDELDEYLSATQLGITVASLGLGWVGEPAFVHLVEGFLGRPAWLSPGASHALSAAVSFCIITFLHILLGELAPKSLAIRRAEQAAIFVAVPMRWAYWLFYLPMIVLNGASNLILRMLKLETGHREVAHSEQELRMLLFATQATGSFSFNQLLIVENLFDLRKQTVRDAMIPWLNVKSLSADASFSEVLQSVREHRFSRVPVLDSKSHAPVKYLLMKDLLLLEPNDTNWQRILRPLRIVRPTDNLELTMQELQRDGANMAVVMDGKTPVGLITLEDVLEEVVGKIEDEYPRLPPLYLKDALQAGAICLDVQATDAAGAIQELVRAIPENQIPPNVDITALALAREQLMTTDVGHGVAIPHARCPGLARPLLVFGRSEEGIPFSPHATEPVRLLFLLVTPADRPNLQVFFLSQLANVAKSEFVREKLRQAKNPDELLQIIEAADPAVTG
jgi:CBS domain containing-hemolysin-like protein/mannitol/fructose-specific phosphotransferase system IIA component (Ntr-type)